MKYKMTVRSQNKLGMSDPVFTLMAKLMEPMKQIAKTKRKEEESDDNKILEYLLQQGVKFRQILMTV